MVFRLLAVIGLSTILYHSCFAQLNFSAPPAAYPDGSFSEPSGLETFDLGDIVQIEWETTYELMDLFIVRGEDFAGSSILVQSNISARSLSWQVQTSFTDLSVPFVFRGVDSLGDAEAKYNGGFLSWYFTLKNTRSPISSTSSAATSQASIATPVSSSNDVQTTSTPTNSATANAALSQAPSSITVSATPGASGTANNVPDHKIDRSTSDTKVGLGLGLGLGIPLALAIGTGIYLCGRWRYKRSVAEPVRALPSLAGLMHHNMDFGKDSRHEAYVEPAELISGHESTMIPRYELYGGAPSPLIQQPGT